MNDNHTNRAPGKPKKTVRVFQANVNKDWAAHSTALALARKGGYTVVMLQEPWTSTKDSYTVTHKAYSLYSPVPYWHDTLTRPRVVTYVLRNSGLTANQLTPHKTRDMLWVKAGKITFVNVYRQAGDTHTMRILETWPIPADCVVLGDFNSRHPLWQAG
jgi:endonuclease/exonuclease/phosphatase (EEP) superfamily protein YafD